MNTCKDEAINLNSSWYFSQKTCLKSHTQNCNTPFILQKVCHAEVNKGDWDPYIFYIPPYDKIGLQVEDLEVEVVDLSGNPDLTVHSR